MPTGDAIIELIVSPRSPQWLIDHAAEELTQDEILWTTDGRWAFGVTGTPISGLTFFPSMAVGAVWGAITGSITNQTDLINYIDAAITAMEIYTDAGLATKADKQNGLISGGELTVETIDGTGTLNDYRLAAATYYIIGTGNVSSTEQIYLNIALSSAGNVRYVAFYGDNAGTVTKVEGAEGASAVIPDGPVGSVLLNYSLVTDAAIFEGVDLSNYLLKADKTTPAEFAAGVDNDKYATAYAHANASQTTSILSSAAPTAVVNANPNITDYLQVLALAIAATFAAPTGTLVNNKKLMFRIKDNGIARALLFNAVFQFSTDLTAPTTTTVGKTLYLGFQYNSTELKWVCLFKLYV